MSTLPNELPTIILPKRFLIIGFPSPEYIPPFVLPIQVNLIAPVPS
jgi:hypothetical protein